MTWCILHTWAGGGEGVNCPSTDCIQHSYGGCMLHDGRLDQKTNSSLIILINIIFRIQQLTFHTTQFRVLGFIMDLNIRVQLCASNNQTRKVGWVSNNLVFRGNLIAFVLKVFSAAPGYNCSSATASCMRTLLQLQPQRRKSFKRKLVELQFVSAPATSSQHDLSWGDISCCSFQQDVVITEEINRVLVVFTGAWAYQATARSLALL